MRSRSTCSLVCVILVSACGSTGGNDGGADAAPDAASCMQTWPLASSGTSCESTACPTGFVCYEQSGGIGGDGSVSPSHYCYPLGDCASIPTCACVNTCGKEFCVNGGELTCNVIDGGTGLNVFCGLP